MNERLRRAMLQAGFDTTRLAGELDVSIKSVERWLAGTTVPYPKTRYRVAVLLGQDESYLWPEATNHKALTGIEFVSAFPRRTDVPKHLWVDLLQDAKRNVDVLAFAGLFLAEEHPEWLPTLRDRATAGARIRLLLGDIQGEQLAARDKERAIGGGVRGRVQSVLTHYHPLSDVVEIRLHDTPLYNSIYRFDDDMLVNVHVYGLLAAYTPVLRLKCIDGAYFNTYVESFEQVWATARPYTL